MKKKEIAQKIDAIDIQDLAYKINAYYRKPGSNNFIPLLPRVEPYVSSGISQQHIWEEMVRMVLNGVRKEFKIRPQRMVRR